jgi:hypothetical protein
LANEVATPGIPGAWYIAYCYGQYNGIEWFPASNPPTGPAPAAPKVDPLDLAEQAERSISVPSPSILTNPPESGIVNLPTWLWIDSSLWHSRSVSASAGGVSATATATPVSVTWSTGDGASLVCDGPGVPYDPSIPSAGQSTYCEHTYSVSSLGEPSPDGSPNDAAFTLTAAVTWDVSWTASSGAGGSLAQLDTNSSERLRVEQVESVNTDRG